jgi:hypothetical protein
MLGFLFGVLFMLALPRRGETAAPEAPPPGPSAPASLVAKPPVPRLTTIEDVFAEWGGPAVWENDVTQVALLADPDTDSHREYYEVRRVGEDFYFRSIPAFDPDRRVLTHGVPDDPALPLEFTETAAQREQWLQASHTEAGRAVIQAFHLDGSGGQAVGPPPISTEPIPPEKSAPTAP